MSKPDRVPAIEFVAEDAQEILQPQPRKRLSMMTWVAPTYRLALYVAIFAIVVYVWPVEPVGVLLIGCSAFLGLYLVDWLLAASPAKVAIDRQVPDRIMLNTQSYIRWAVHNPFGRTIRVEVVDTIPHSFRCPKRNVAMKIQSGETKFFSIPIRPQRRGEMVMPSPVLRTFGPFHLLVKQATVQLETTVMVNPAFPSRPLAELKLRDARRLISGMRMVRMVGQTGEFDHLREYTPDDEIRRINWAATARAQKPIVQVNRAEKNQRVIILLDNGRTMAGSMRRYMPNLSAYDNHIVDPNVIKAEAEQNDISQRLDHAMDTVMGLTLVATGMADHVGMVRFEQEVLDTIAPGTGAEQLRFITNSLASTHVHLIEPDFKEAISQTVTRFPRRSLVVILTDLASGPVEENLLPALPQLTRRHIVIVASPRDPVLSAMQSMIPDDEHAAFSLAAAIHRVSLREDLARKLTAAGAQVIDADPIELTPKVIDAYLDMKSTGKL